MNDPAVLIIPGLRDHVADHWQTHLQGRLARARTVPPLTHDRLSLAARLGAIAEAAASLEGPILICAHSAGVLMAVHWALTASERVAGALLACPPDLETPMPAGYPTMAELEAGGWLPVPRQPLPFPALVLGSDNDPLASPARTADLAEAWGARLVNLGPVGHLNPASGHGDWREAEHWLAEAQRLAAFGAARG